MRRAICPYTKEVMDCKKCFVPDLMDDGECPYGLEDQVHEQVTKLYRNLAERKWEVINKIAKYQEGKKNVLRKVVSAKE